MTNAKQTIQEKIKALDQLVEWFQSDDFQLEAAAANLKKAAELARDIEHDLESIVNDVNKVKKSFASESDV